MVFKPIRDNDRKSFEKKPFVELSDTTMKIRRNLLLVSFFAYVMLSYDVKVNATRTPLFFIEGLSSSEIVNILATLIVYFLVSFIWNSWNEVIKWRLKLTVGHPDSSKNQIGLRVLKCLDQEPQFHAGKIKNEIDNISRQINSFPDESTEVDVDSRKNELFESWKLAIKEDLDRIEYFEHWFWAYGKQQRLKFFFIDIGLPIIFSMAILYNLFL
ncbi:hypothetical protein [Vibrio splendidus]|uniref:hypothetical protein n=1 Tax=Vibrio splendidus TaxID=29497 RepID=UPI000769B3F3|nr:hypothetical protein [Vibrio splendidus]